MRFGAHQCCAVEKEIIVAISSEPISQINLSVLATFIGGSFV